MASKKTQQAAEGLLSSLGVRGNFQDLVRKAVIQGWTADEFADALIKTKQFRKAYPGLIANGAIHTDFGRPGGASNLINAVSNYRQGYDDFQAVSRNTSGMKVNKRMFAAAIRNDISPEEFGTRLLVNQQLQRNPEMLDEFNSLLKFQGAQTLDEVGKRKFLAKAADPKLYDTYEAAFLRSSGLDIDRGDAIKVAQGIAKGSNLGQIVSEVNRIKPDIAPELRRAGISDADLAQLANGQDPRNLGATLEGIVANRRAMRSTGSAYLTQTSTGGLGLSTNPEDEAASY